MSINMPDVVKFVGIGIEGRPVNNTIKKDIKKLQESIKFDKEQSKELAEETVNNLSDDFDVNDKDISKKLNNM